MDEEELVEMLPSHSPLRRRHRVFPQLARRWLPHTLVFAVLYITTVLYLLWSQNCPRSIPSTGTVPDTPPPSSSTDDPVWSVRASSVKQAFIHAYDGYERYTSFPDDELRPISNSGQRNFNGWGVTAVDSLDTMWLMGLTPWFDKAVGQISTLNFSLNHTQHAPFFETVIRYLGGLLSAHALSGEPIILARAEELGRKLLPAFNTPSGLPQFSVNTETGDIKDSSDRVGRLYLAEVASCQVEFKYLAHLTGTEAFYQKAEKIVTLMHDAQMADGLWDTIWDVNSGLQINDHVGVAAWADSAYEYLLKQYLLSGRSEVKLRDMYLKAISGVIRNLLFLSPTRNLLYLSDLESHELTGKFEHLACFFPGLLALGIATLDLPADVRQLHMWAAEGLAHSCWIMYADQPSGLGPELAIMDKWPGDWRKGRWIDHVEEWQRAGQPGGKPPGVRELAPPAKAGEQRDYLLQVSTYLSRPETLESMFVMWHTTKDPIWREHGWSIWEAIENKTRTSSGYASVERVDQVNPYLLDSMPSYFLSETIKYAYLLTMGDNPWPADKFVLNTEAHPLPIFTWRDWEKQRYGII